MIFNNEDGYEAGGLVYRGTRDKDGKIEAGSILTFDQYRNDQVVTLGYDQTGDRKRNGLTINDRPDVQSELVKEMFRAMAAANSVAEAESIRRTYMSKIPGRDVVARRLFAGRDVEGASLVTLSDPDGKPRLQLKVDSLGKASITFLDSSGRVIRIIKP